MSTFEKAIKQSNFKSQTQKGILNILFSANWIRDKTAHFFKEHGILQQHYNILRIVKGKNGPSHPMIQSTKIKRRRPTTQRPGVIMTPRSTVISPMGLMALALF